MSEHKVNGGDMLLFIDPLGGTNYDTVVCLTSVGIRDSVQPVDASSACGPDKSPGAVDMSISFEGQHLQDPNTGDISGTDLRILLRAEQTIGWKLSPLNPVAGDEIQEGTGYLSELSSTYSYSDVAVFSGTIQPYGLPTTITQSTRFNFRVYTDQLAGEILIASSLFCNFVIYWGDGTSDAYYSDSEFLNHTYPSLGYYIVEIENLSTSTNMIFLDSGFDIDNINNLSSFFSGSGYQASQLGIVNSNLSSADVNNILHQCISIPAINQSGCVIALSGNIPIAPPTGQGLTDKATLESNGVTVTVDTAPAFSVGDSYGGGIVAYVDMSGLHGFVVYDNGASVSTDHWATNNNITGATGSALGDGANNTISILGNTTSNPAIACSTGNFNGYNDWVMPSTDELGEVIQAHIDGYLTNLTGSFYWTSTEQTSNNAYMRENMTNTIYSADKTSSTFDTVAIRYF